MLELDHVFCIVGDPGTAARRLEDDGWALDAGQAHRGQGTRNRRLVWPGLFFELMWVTDMGEARSNPLRLDRRVDTDYDGCQPTRSWVPRPDRPSGQRRVLAVRRARAAHLDSSRQRAIPGTAACLCAGDDGGRNESAPPTSGWGRPSSAGRTPRDPHPGSVRPVIAAVCRTADRVPARSPSA